MKKGSPVVHRLAAALICNHLAGYHVHVHGELNGDIIQYRVHQVNPQWPDDVLANGTELSISHSCSYEGVVLP